ncbi:hypothetical protein CBE37_04340 [bacterium TMED277]|nr:MAG: hypothetical protein CBE37_04340 [bacterium TMED277]
MINKKVLLIAAMFYSSSIANEINSRIIIENCKSCHGENLKGNSYIKSLMLINKETFITKMKEYKLQKKDSVMMRIVKPLTLKDIKKIADLIYDDK